MLFIYKNQIHSEFIIIAHDILGRGAYEWCKVTINFSTGLTGIRNTDVAVSQKGKYPLLSHHLMNNSTSTLEPYVLQGLSLLRNVQGNPLLIVFIDSSSWFLDKLLFLYNLS